MLRGSRSANCARINPRRFSLRLRTGGVESRSTPIGDPLNGSIGSRTRACAQPIRATFRGNDPYTKQSAEKREAQAMRTGARRLALLCRPKRPLSAPVNAARRVKGKRGAVASARDKCRSSRAFIKREAANRCARAPGRSQAPPQYVFENASSAMSRRFAVQTRERLRRRSNNRNFG